MSKNNGSAKALIDSGRGGKKRANSKYNHRDEVLKGFCAMPGCTTNELSVEYFDWIRERYKNAPKRAHDLLLLGYLERLDNRTCRYSGKEGHTFKITQKGVDYLRRNNQMPVIKKDVKEASVPVAKVKPSFADMRSALS